MRKFALKKCSLLGLTLIAAAAVAAAVLPSKSSTPENKKNGRNGHIVIGGDNDGVNADTQTCVGDSLPNPDCTSTATGPGIHDSKTSGIFFDTSDTSCEEVNTSIGPNDILV